MSETSNQDFPKIAIDSYEGPDPYLFASYAHEDTLPVSHVLEALEKELSAKVAFDPETPVLVRGDERLTYGAVMDVVKLVYKCKVKRMSLVTVEK